MLVQKRVYYQYNKHKNMISGRHIQNTQIVTSGPYLRMWET